MLKSSHSGGAEMKITWIDALVIERQVLLVDYEATHSFLTVTRREFVAKFRTPCLANEYLDESLVVIGVADEHFVDVACHG